MDQVKYITDLLKKYYELFGEVPLLPKMVSYTCIADLMEDAIISKTPVNQDDITKAVSEISDPIDLE